MNAIDSSWLEKPLFDKSRSTSLNILKQMPNLCKTSEQGPDILQHTPKLADPFVRAAGHLFCAHGAKCGVCVGGGKIAVCGNRPAGWCLCWSLGGHRFSLSHFGNARAKCIRMDSGRRASIGIDSKQTRAGLECLQKRWGKTGRHAPNPPTDIRWHRARE